MEWFVELHEEFLPEYRALDVKVQDHILHMIRMLQQFGPALGRPYVDTLKGSSHANMKEIRISAADGEWRVAFAFDPRRKALLLVAGDKSGISEKLFYRTFIHRADERFNDHLKRQNSERN